VFPGLKKIADEDFDVFLKRIEGPPRRKALDEPKGRSRC
jgi:hypothetical protein